MSRLLFCKLNLDRVEQTKWAFLEPGSGDTVEEQAAAQAFPPTGPRTGLNDPPELDADLDNPDLDGPGEIEFSYRFEGLVLDSPDEDEE